MSGTLTEIAAFTVYAFTSIFVIVNPVGDILTFISLTEGMTIEERRQTTRRAVTVACILAILFALAGEIVLRLFNIFRSAVKIK